MNFDFSEEALAIQETARAYLQDRHAISELRRVVDGAEPFSRQLWSDMAEMGWLGVTVPERWGGADLGDEVACLLATELGRALAAVPWLSSVQIAAELLVRLGTRAQQERWLPRLCDGTVIAAVARPIAEERGMLSAGGQLGCCLPAVVDSLAATLLLVPVTSADAMSIRLVELTNGESSRTATSMLDPSRSAATITLRGAATEVLGTAADAAPIYHRVMDRAAILIAFEQLGGAEACLWAARDYALSRTAFGRQVGSFQAIKHKLADVYVAIELARSHAYYGALALGEPSADLGVAADAARISASGAFGLAAKENIHVHGGFGFTWEYDCHLFYRRSRHLAQVLGSERRALLRLGAQLLTPTSRGEAIIDEARHGFQ